MKAKSTHSKKSSGNSRPLVVKKRQSGKETQCIAVQSQDHHVLRISDCMVSQHIGMRDYMEDYWLAETMNDRFFVAFCFDGHGGSEAAAFLQQRLHNDMPALCHRGLLDTDIPIVLKAMFEKLAKDFKSLGLPSGTTICGLVFDLQCGVVTTCNLGDSQAIICGIGGVIYFVNQRHSCGSILERMRLASLDITVKETDTWRIAGMLNVSKAFGNHDSKRLEAALDKSGRVPDISQFMIEKKRGIVVVATDGLWDELPAEMFAQDGSFRQKNAGDLLDILDLGSKGDNCAIIKFIVQRA